MKKLFLLIAAACASLTAAADEGMWLLPYLQKMNIKEMKARGCKLSAEEIYSVNKSSLKDAIVIFPDVRARSFRPTACCLPTTTAATVRFRRCRPSNTTT